MTIFWSGPTIKKFKMNHKAIASIKLINFLRIGDRPFWGSARPRGPRKPFQKVGRRSPPPSGMVSRTPGAAQTPKMTDFQCLKHSKNFKPSQSAATVEWVHTLAYFIVTTRALWAEPGIDPWICPRNRQCAVASQPWLHFGWLY